MPDIPPRHYVNPYIAGSAVKGAEMFFGREDVFAFIRRNLIGQHSNHPLVLYGQRRTGKTSVLHQLHRHLDPGYWCVLIDLHGLNLDGLGNLMQGIATVISRELRRDHQVAVEVPERPAFLANPAGAFEGVFLDRVWAALGDNQLVLMLDEAVRLDEEMRAGRLDRGVFDYLRHLMQHHDGLNFVFSLGSGIEEMSRDYAFLFSVSLYHRISFLEPSAARDLITRPARGHYELTGQAVDRILQVTSGHPYYTQLVCHCVFDAWARNPTPTVGVGDVDDVLSEAIELGSANLTFVWVDSSPAEQMLMAGIAAAMRGGTTTVTADQAREAWRGAGVEVPGSEITQALRRLAGREIVTGTGRYSFTVDLQRLWLDKHRRLHWVREDLAGQIAQWNPSELPSPAELSPAEAGRLEAGAAHGADEGRQQYLRLILGDGNDRHPLRDGAFYAVEGIPGIGKTSLLQQLARNADDSADVIININCADFEKPGRAPSSDEAADLRQFRTLLRDSLPDVVEAPVDALYWAESLPGLGGRQRPRRTTTTGELIEFAAEAMTLLTRELTLTGGRLLVLVDDWDLIAGRPLGTWVMHMLAGIKGADVVVTCRQLPGRGSAELPSRAVRLRLGNLDYADVERYLATRFGVGSDLTRITGPVWEFTGGHPQALAYVADLLLESSGHEAAARLARGLGASQRAMPRPLKALADRILDAVDDAELRYALCTACVTRRFDRPLLERLLHVDKRSAEILIERLRTYSFIQESADEHPLLTISPFLRRAAENRVDAARQQEIHAAAADYLQNLVTDTTQGKAWPQARHRLEDLRFQVYERERLYHRGRITGRGSSRVGLARTFFDAFWRRGCQVPLEFCEEILADWASTSPALPDDQLWVKELRTVYDCYPRRGRPEEVPRRQWIMIRRALRALWSTGGFDDQPATPDMRHVRGALDIFLADVLRCIDPADPDIDWHLNDAEQQLADDDRMVAWSKFQRAELWLARGQARQAGELAVQAARDHAELGDHELIASLHRVHADACWTQDQYAAALDGYARAIAHAYRLSVTARLSGHAVAFQRELTDRCLDRIAALHGQGSDSARSMLSAACARIRDFFGAYWREMGTDPQAATTADVLRALEEGHPNDIAGMLFPAEPATTELRHPGSEYQILGIDVLHQMARELAHLPGTPLPPAGNMGTVGEYDNRADR